MIETLTKKKIWFIFPLFLIAVILFVLKTNISFDLIKFKREENSMHNFFMLLVVSLPLLTLFLFDHWREQPLIKKMLLVGLSSSLSAVVFEIHIVFQFSAFFTATALIYLFSERKVYRPELFHILLFIYFIISAISLVWSSNPPLGFSYLRNISAVAYVPILFLFFKLSKRDFEVVGLYIIRFSILFAFLSIVSWIVQCNTLDFPLASSFDMKKHSIGSYDSFAAVYAWSGMYHPTYIALMMLFSLSLGWYFVLKPDIRDNIAYIEFVCLLLAILLLTIITASRFALVIWVFVNVAGLIYVVRKKKKLFIASILLITIFTSVLSLHFSEKMQYFIKDPVRKCHYNVAFQAIEENTWHGTGLGGMTKYINRNNPAYDPLNIPPEEDFPHIQPHNQIIGDLMQTGIFGLAAILLIIGTLFYYSFKQRNWLLLVNTIVFLMIMTIEMPLMHINGIFMFAMFFCFLLAERNCQEIKCTTQI